MARVRKEIVQIFYEYQFLFPVDLLWKYVNSNITNSTEENPS